MRAARARGEATPPESVRGCVTTLMEGVGGLMRIGAGGATLAELGSALELSVQAPIVDMTGRTDRFDVTLEFANLAAAAPSELPSVFTAVQEQLGLRLERRVVPASVLVIDSVERPTPD
jgi:uncharacterized protein (TIGR03435 family)